MDVVLDELLRQPADPPVRPDGPTARILSDLWLGGMPLPRAATAAGLSVAAAEQALRSFGLLPAAPGPNSPELSPRVEPPRKRPWRRWSALRDDVVRLYGEGRTVRAIGAELGMHQREVWRQLARAGVPRWPRGTPGVVLSRRALERLYVRDGLSVAEVARRFDTSTEVVRRKLDRHGLPRRRQVPLDPVTLRRLYVDQRLGVRAVGERLGVSPDKVRSVLARYGIPSRPPGRPGRSTR